MIARLDHLQSITNYNPISRETTNASARLERTPHRGCVCRGPRLSAERFYRNQHIDIDKAVINWRNQRVRHAMGDKTEVLCSARCIYYDEVVSVLAAYPLKLRGELLESCGLI